jgi:hypothetical protein
MTNPDDRTPYTPGHQPSRFANVTAGYVPPTHNLITGQPIEAPKKKSRLPLILAAVVGLLVVIAVTVGVTVAAQRGTSPAASKTSGQSAWDREQQVGAGTTPDPTPVVVDNTPAASDLKLTLKTTDKQCFGSAGCNLTVKVNLGYDGPTLSDDDTWQVTYEINGVTDGPLIGSFEMTGDTYTVNEESVETKSSKSKVTVKVTSVEKVGL